MQRLSLLLVSADEYEGQWFSKPLTSKKPGGYPPGFSVYTDDELLLLEVNLAEWRVS